MWNCPSAPSRGGTLAIRRRNPQQLRWLDSYLMNTLNPKAEWPKQGKGVLSFFLYFIQGVGA
jgi:hypothetical protein